MELLGAPQALLMKKPNVLYKSQKLMKTISIPLTDKQYSYLSRVGEENRRKLQDVIYLMLETGGQCCCYDTLDCAVKKLEEEFSEEDKAQIKLNKKIEDENSDLCFNEKQKLGFKHVSKHFTEDEFREIFKSIGNLIIDPSPVKS